MKHLRRHIHIIAVLVCVGTFLLSVKAEADTAYPTTIHDVESVGTYHWDDGTNHIDIYASDIQNLHNELYSLGTYSADTFAGYSARLAAIDTTVTNGKQSMATKIKAYNSSAAVSGSSTYAQLANALPDVYTAGYNAGIAATKAAVNASGGLTTIISQNDPAGNGTVYNRTWTNTTGHTVYVFAKCGENHIDHNHGHIDYSKIWVGGTLVASDIQEGGSYCSTSWSGNVANGATVKVETKGCSGSSGSNVTYHVIIATN